MNGTTDPIATLQLSRHGVFTAEALEFTALDFETTDLHPGHIVEIGAVRVRADGTPVAEFSTLVNPGRGIDPGPTHIHRITRHELDSAHPLRDVLGYLVDLCRGSVVVAHNMPFEKRFLARELARLGMHLPPLPGVCTLSAARQALRLPNYRLATVARSLGLGDFASHMALADARVCAQVISSLVTTHGLAFTTAPQFPDLPQLPRTSCVLARPEAVSAGANEWLAGLADRMPQSARAEAEPVLHQAYRDLLADALTDHHISAEEARELAALASRAGIPGEDVRRMHAEFVAAMRKVAESDGVVTPAEERELRQVADALDVPEVLDGMSLTGGRASAARVLVLGTSAEADDLRAAVLAAGLRLAKKLTVSVTHVVTTAAVLDSEPRLQRAKEMGIPVLDGLQARRVLGLAAPEAAPDTTVVLPAVTSAAPAVPPARESAPPPVTPVAAPPRPTLPAPAPRQPQLVLPAPARSAPVHSQGNISRLRDGQLLMAIGILLMAASVLALFGGATLASGLAMGALGVGILLGGWWLTEQARFRMTGAPQPIPPRNASASAPSRPSAPR